MKKIEIFEARGITDSYELDRLIIELYKKYGNKILFRKINVLDSKLSSHKHVAEILKEQGISALPIICVDDKISSIEDLQQLLLQ